jgi:hypothetical protein
MFSTEQSRVCGFGGARLAYSCLSTVDPLLGVANRKMVAEHSPATPGGFACAQRHRQAAAEPAQSSYQSMGMCPGEPSERTNAAYHDRFHHRGRRPEHASRPNASGHPYRALRLDERAMARRAPNGESRVGETAGIDHRSTGSFRDDARCSLFDRCLVAITRSSARHRFLDFGDRVTVRSNTRSPQVDFFRRVFETMRRKESPANAHLK